jgi:hypothetical protein
MRSILRCVTLALLAASCGDATMPGGTTAASAGLLNATASTLDVLVDGKTVATGVASSAIASLNELNLSPGQHQVRVQPSSGMGPGATVMLTASAGATHNLVAYLAGAALSARVLEDTGAIVPAGKSKVRVINLAPGSDIDIWRTQPDFPTGIRFQFPFPFDTVPGPYFQSDAGDWEAWITTTSDWTTKLHETGAFTVPSGEKRTVVVVDSAGTLRLRVLID